MTSSSFTLALVASALVLGPAHSQEAPPPPQESVPAEDDMPGDRHWIRPEDLPAPVNEGDPEAPDFENNPVLVDAPAGRMPDVPDGFEVEVFASGFTQPRVMRTAPNGDIFLAESGTGRVLTFDADAALPAEPEVFAEGLDRPFGIAFYPVSEPRYVYVAAADRVVRYPYDDGDREATGPGEVIISNIPTERHWTRDLAVSPDGEHLFVSIGSASNVAGAMSETPPGGIEAWEATHGLGAAWDDETNRAVVRVFDPEGLNVRNYATGLRNCSGMTIQPETDQLWCTVNERDHLGADVVPDMLTTVEGGAFYGWPWYYAGGFEDPAHAGERPDLADQVTAPDVLIQAHSSTMQLLFYDAQAFPAEYHGDAFATLRGSWNREHRTGYKVVRAIMEDGVATGEYVDFMTGFVLDAERVWGRPVGITLTHDGALLVGDDANGTIFRVSATEPEAPEEPPYGFFLNDAWDTTANHVFMYGRFADEVLIGDWDGDGTDSITVRRGNTYYVNNTLGGGEAEHVFVYGRPDDTVLVGDWDGDGVDTLAVRRGAEYHVKNDLAGGPADQVVVYGRSGDQVVVGDWDGDELDTFAVRRGATYFVKNTIAAGEADQVVVYGRAGDITLAGDWDGDGDDTFAVRRGATYYVKNTIAPGEADIVLVYGRAGDEIYVGDWNGDGEDTLGVRRAP
ncbi:hypothetical protein GB881_04775 [Georgenia subflava]|uniref:Pyrroloquinoline quinone-dependent pyranose dehydrogenase beta-propeller domain-containing protein n=1 Tax=Georgenia subflava TaxID=1622177 RepID=A0A6N7EG47_9MICO|nr:hypothetical protein [Georgenia subflava]